MSTSLLRHTLATLAYRAGKELRDAPPSFADFRPAPGSRSPGEILAHMGDLFDWALTICDGPVTWTEAPRLGWDGEVARCFAALALLDARLAEDQPLDSPPATLFQGPIADALQHTGQLTYLRRLAGVPIRGESCFRSEIEVGWVGLEQAAPRREFDRGRGAPGRGAGRESAPHPPNPARSNNPPNTPLPASTPGRR